MDEERMERVGRNEALFRAVNEHVEGLNDTFGALTGTMVVVCECADPMCIEQIELSREQYETVRSSPTQFAVKPGHIVDDVEHVCRKADGHWVVGKDGGEPAKVAEQLDTRKRSR